ncbi:hypothetical protein QC763_0001950 [Podospora pseudopauciseta]|uniref:Beta and gamma crystallin n=1 Tax=Podospora pseudopauciseta TaxID=2093780 RepID=A0ABR0HWH9_9PEZI|nr:hypothetical protein QC763_0001950 [Podospora pseudopauciseta]
MVNPKCFTALLTMSVLTTAAPAPAADAEEGKPAPRQTGRAVYTCHHTYWGAPCQPSASINNHLVNVPSDWNNVISSIRNQTAWSCTWYEHGNCEGRSYTNQEDAKLADGDGFFNDRISSWRCY